MMNDGVNPPAPHPSGWIDINCHILPGADHGARNMEETVEMLKIAYEEGIRTIVAVSRYDGQHCLTDEERLEELIRQVQEEAGKIDPEFQVFHGHEIYYSSDSHEKLMTGELKTIAGSRYVMIAFPEEIDYKSVRKAVRDVIMEGFIPIVAHVEQYPELTIDIERIEGLIQRGAYIQITAKSVTGEFGHDIKSFARSLLKHQLVHFIGTDACDADERAPYIKECADYIERKYGNDYVEELLTANPLAVIENDDIDI